LDAVDDRIGRATAIACTANDYAARGDVRVLTSNVGLHGASHGGNVCLKVEHDAGKWTFTEAWRNGDLNCHPGNYVVANGCAFGKGKGGLTCVDLKTGQTQWKERVDAGQVCWADGRLYVFADNGDRITLVDPAAPEGAKAKGSFKVEGTGKSWSHPVVVNGRLYLRYDTNLYCYDVKAR
jgi:outer membrane protein assembly factor BamB